MAQRITRALRLAGVAVLAVAALAVAQDATLAQSRGERAFVTAQSRYGNGSLTAPIRKTWYGHEVQLPGGAWIDCARDCREALRRQKLDFWETMREEGGGIEWDTP
jgi:hypothetical protein